MSTPDSQEKQKSPEPMESGDKGVSKAERKASGEAETGKDNYYESITKQARELKKAREGGVRTETHKEFGTPTIEGDEGTLIPGGAPSPATIADAQQESRTKDAVAQGSAEQTGKVFDYKVVQESKSTFSLGMDYEEKAPDTRTPIDKLGDFMQAATRRATDPAGWKAWAQGEIDKFGGIGEGLNEAKDETKAAVAAGWKALTDGTVVEFLSQPNAINAPVFKTIANAFDAMSKDPNAVNKAFESLGHVVMKASEGYTNLPNHEKGKVIGKVMFGMVNPEGSTEGAEAALKVADQVATHVDKTVWNAIDQTMLAIKDMTPDLAAQTKQALYDYIKDSGLTGPQLEAAGIPRDYFAAMSEDAGGKGDNFFAMSNAGEGDGIPNRMKLSESAGEIEYQIDKDTGRLFRTDMGKARRPYNWEALNERFSTEVLRQSTKDSCISAVGDMLTDGKVTEQELIHKLGERPGIKDLPDLLGTGWTSEARNFKSLAEIGQHRPWGAEMMENSGTELEKSFHAVVVDGINSKGLVVIRDPWEGTIYEMTQDKFLKDWTRGAVYRH